VKRQVIIAEAIKELKERLDGGHNSAEVERIVKEILGRVYDRAQGDG
jgi:hypothetical protein